MNEKKQQKKVKIINLKKWEKVVINYYKKN